MGKLTLIVLAVALAAVVQCFDSDALVKRMASMITTDEFEALQRGELVAKRALTGPDGTPIDLDKIDLSNPYGHFTCAKKHIADGTHNTRTVTVIKYHYKNITFKKRIGYTKCGGLGWSRCSLYGIGYSTERESYNDVIEVEDVRNCPKEDIVCAQGYIMLSDANCIGLHQIDTQLAYNMCRMIKLGLMNHDANSSQLDLPEDCELLKQVSIGEN